MTMQVIQHIELGSAAASIDFQNIAQTFTDLYLTVSARNTSSSGLYTISFNGSTSGFSTRGLFGGGSSAGSFTSPGDYGGEVVFSSQTANTFSSNSIYIPNYTSSANKSFSVDGVQENNATGSNQVISAGLWSNTAAITRVTLNITGTFAAGSSATLYGITKGSDGTTTVS